MEEGLRTTIIVVPECLQYQSGYAIMLKPLLRLHTRRAAMQLVSNCSCGFVMTEDQCTMVPDASEGL